MNQEHKSYSPTQLALRRLLRNHLAIAGLVLLVVIIIFVLTGSMWVNSNPSETRIWIGKQPPGFRHPDCGSEMHFDIGAKAQLPGHLLTREKITYEIRTTKRIEYRVVLRRRKVSSIASGANHKDKLDLTRIPTDVRVLREDNEWGRKLPKAIIKEGEPPPDGLFEGRQRVLILGWEESGPREKTTVSLKNGIVTAIQRGGKQVKLTSISGPSVESVHADRQLMEVTHPLGTDDMGRDLFVRVVKGGQISLLVGLVATAVSLLIGVVYGAVAGYLGGAVDTLMMRFVDILYGLPFIFLVLLLMVVFDRNIVLLFVALGMVQWLTMARIVRGQFLSLRKREFVEAAQMCGAGGLKIIFIHLLPHCLGPIIVYATLTVPVVILEESFLAFIGLPVQYQGTTLDSWGSLVHQGMSCLGDEGQGWWLLIFPSLAMVMTLFSLNCLGDGLRDSFDPKGE